MNQDSTAVRSSARSDRSSPFGREKPLHERRMLVVGATGQLGTLLIRKCSGAGRSVRALVRPSSDYRYLEGPGVDLCLGDLRDRESLERACRGVDAILATATVIFPRGTYAFDLDEGIGYQNLLQACARQGVRQFVFISIIPFPEPYVSLVPTFRFKRLIENLAMKSGITYTIFRAGPFMDDYFALIGSRIPLRGAEAASLRRPFWFTRMYLSAVQNAIERWGIACLPGPRDSRHSFIALDDVAEFMLQAVGHPAALNLCCDLGGPEVLSWGDVVDLYAKLLGRPVRSISVPTWISRLSMQALEWASPGAANQLGILWALGANNELTADSRELARSFGVRLTSAEEFLRAKLALPDDPQ